MCCGHSVSEVRFQNSIEVLDCIETLNGIVKKLVPVMGSNL